MEKYFNKLSNWLAIFGGWFAFLVGGWDNLISTLLVLIVVDYITGYLKGLFTKELSSKTGAKGIVKKVYILSIVCLAVMCERIGIPAVREMTIMFFIANEGLSILENASEIGLPIPDFIENSLVQVRKSKEGEKENAKE